MAEKKYRRKPKYGTEHCSTGKYYRYKKKTNRKWRPHKEQPVLPFEEAREIVRQEKIQSKSEYFKWHRKNEIENIPFEPSYCAAYRGKWINWNDWLGNNNTFGQRKYYRSYAEALVYAHEHPAMTGEEWKNAEHPDDIPRRPDLTYHGKFTGWNSFLGTGNKKASNIVELEKAKQTIPHILIIGKHLLSPPNEYIISVIQGESKSREYVQANNIVVQKAFYMDNDFDWHSCLAQHGTDMGDGSFHIPNINEFLFQIPWLWCQL